MLLDRNPAGGFDAAQNRLSGATGLMRDKAFGLFSLRWSALPAVRVAGRR